MTTGTIKATDRFVRVGDLNLHYLEWGQAGAPPVIMVHGLSGNAHAFDNLAPNFLPMYHVIAVDVRGRGDSDWAGDADYSNDAYVADLEGLRQALGFERISLVGTSLGGRISMTYAGAYPDRVERTVLNDIGPQIDPRGGNRIAVRPGKRSFPLPAWTRSWLGTRSSGPASICSATPSSASPRDMRLNPSPAAVILGRWTRQSEPIPDVPTRRHPGLSPS